MTRAISTTSADFCMLNRLIEYAAGTPRTSDSTVAANATQRLLPMNWT